MLRSLNINFMKNSFAFALLPLHAVLTTVAPAQETINTAMTGPIYGNGSSITVTGSGTIDGISSGSGVISTGTNTTTTLTNEGRIEAYSRGVLNDATGSFGTITNSGTIIANWAVATTGTIGTLDNQIGGSIIGDAYAIIAEGGAITTLQNAGSITGYNAIILANTAIGTLTNSGTAASSGGNGLRLGAGGSIGSLTNSGLISGQPGLQLEAATSTLTVTNSGTISGYNGFVSSGTLGTFTNTSTGLVQGGNLGFLQRGGSVDQISNVGTITSGGYGIGLDGGATLDTLTNSGTISGGDQGLILAATGTVNNLTSGLISGTSSDGIVSVISLTRLDNAGSIQGGNHGVNIAAGTAGQITNSGTISGVNSGFNGEGCSTVGSLTNSGTISGNHAVVLANSGTVTNAAGGLINATGLDGVYLRPGASLSSLGNAGTISGVRVGFNGEDGSTVGSLTNSGTISGGNAVVLAASGTLTNAAGGLISATGGDGVYLRPGGSLAGLENAGSITAPNIGININSGATTGTLTNSGTLQGGNYGVFNLGTISKISNSGTISGPDTGTAVFVGTNAVLGDSTGTLGAALVSTGEGALLDGTIVNQGTIHNGFTIGNQSVTVSAGGGLGSFNGGLLEVTDGDLTFSGGRVHLEADMSVNGGLGTVINNSSLELLGTRMTYGNFEQSPGASLVSIFTGSAAASLSIDGTATFGGLLNLELNGFSLGPGQVFGLLSFDSYTGGFTSLALEGLELSPAGTGKWSYNSLILEEIWTANTMSVSVSAVPEPGTSVGLALLLSSAMSLRRRQRA